MGIGSRSHIQSFVGRTEIDIEQSLMVADGWSPRAAGIVLHGIPARLVNLPVYLADVLPVYHVF